MSGAGEVGRGVRPSAVRKAGLPAFPDVEARGWLEGFLVGAHASMSDARDQVLRAAQGVLPAVVVGETGTGKELAARAVHALSPRRGAPFIPVHCAALTESILGSELFGHVRGAFTGAAALRAGCFESADGGFVFLDEISDLPPSAQAALLRVVEYGEIVRVGASQPVHVDVRVVAASSRPLEALVAAGSFRLDLAQRLSGSRILLPPLRDHLVDLDLYVPAFLDEYSRRSGRARPSVSVEGLDRLRRRRWPGNIRQLKNLLWAAAELSDAAAIAVEDLEAVLAHVDGPAPEQCGPPESSDALVRALEASRWNVSLAARRMNRSRSWIHRVMRAYGIRR